MSTAAAFQQALTNVQAQYLCGVPLNRFNWQGILSDLTLHKQMQLLEKTVCMDLVKEYPLRTKYTLRFMRHIIDNLEKALADIHDDLYGIFCNYQAIDASDEKFSYRHFRLIEFDVGVILKEATSNITDGTTGLSVWDAAMALIEWIIFNRHHFEEANVVELGSGTGLCGMLLKKVCAKTRLILTDGNDRVLDCLRENVNNNFGDEKTIQVRRLDWNEIADPEDPSTVNFEWTPDMIIASDIVFDGTDFDPLCTTISKIFETYSNECCMILANAVRNEDTQQKFFEKIDKLQFKVDDLILRPPKHLYWTINPNCPIKLYAISRSHWTSIKFE